MTQGTITSVQNPFVKRLRKLRHRKFREAEGVFLVEGIAHVRRAVEHGAEIEHILVAPELLRSAPALQSVQTQEDQGVSTIRLGRDAFESIVERDHPSGLAATIQIRERSLGEVVAATDSIFVGLHDVGNPGNLGSIIRTVDAIGGSAVIIAGNSTDPLHPAAVKASMGTIFSLPVVRCRSLDDLLGWCLMEGVTLLTTSARAQQSLWETPLPSPALYLFGSEAEGLPDEVMARGLGLRIPMEGAASSLNLAVAAGVILYEAKRRQRSGT